VQRPPSNQRTRDSPGQGAQRSPFKRNSSAATRRLCRTTAAAAVLRSRSYCFTKPSTSNAMATAHSCIGTIPRTSLARPAATPRDARIPSRGALRIGLAWASANRESRRPQLSRRAHQAAGLRSLSGMRRSLWVIDVQGGMRQVLWWGAELAQRIGQLVAAAHQSGVSVIAIRQTFCEQSAQGRERSCVRCGDMTRRAAPQTARCAVCRGAFGHRDTGRTMISGAKDADSKGNRPRSRAVAPFVRLPGGAPIGSGPNCCV
jgi:hypothetical protein